MRCKIMDLLKNKDSDNKYPKSKGQAKSKTYKTRFKDECNSEEKDHYFKITKWNEEVLNIGRQIINEMSDEEFSRLGSKSGTLHFVQLLGLGSKRTTRTMSSKDKDYRPWSTPVGVTLYSDEDIMVPVIDVLKNKDTGIDPEKDITYREVKAGEKFHLTLYECMFLLLRDEYAGFCEANGNERGLRLTCKLSAFMRGDAKLPTPTLSFERNSLIKYADEPYRSPIKAGIVEIDEPFDGGWRIKPEFAEKFGPLLKNNKKRRRTSNKKASPTSQRATVANENELKK